MQRKRPFQSAPFIRRRIESMKCRKNAKVRTAGVNNAISHKLFDASTKNQFDVFSACRNNISVESISIKNPRRANAVSKKYNRKVKAPVLTRKQKPLDRETLVPIYILTGITYARISRIATTISSSCALAKKYSWNFSPLIVSLRNC